MTTRALLLCAAAMAAACDNTETGATLASSPASSPAPTPVVREAFVTDRFQDANFDSMAVWRPPEGVAEVLVTAKSGNVLYAFNAEAGGLIRTLGAAGDGPGQFKRPNGIAIEGDLAIIVERDNARVQVLRMPEGRSIGIFGAGVLRRPYGIATYTQSDGAIAVYVTDNYETPDEQIPPDGELGGRVHHFVVRRSGEGIEATHVRAFGDTHGPGVLRQVETIAVDAAYDRLLIAEELSTIREIKVYTLAGRFTGQVIPSRLFKYEPEGLALYRCGEKDGFWVATDQHPEENVFHLLDRRTLALRGTFKGDETRQTDGIALTRGTLGALRGGAVYAAHKDTHISAFSWEAIAQATGLQANGCW